MILFQVISWCFVFCVFRESHHCVTCSPPVLVGSVFVWASHDDLPTNVERLPLLEVSWCWKNSSSKNAERRLDFHPTGVWMMGFWTHLGCIFDGFLIVGLVRIAVTANDSRPRIFVQQNELLHFPWHPVNFPPMSPLPVEIRPY